MLLVSSEMQGFTSYYDLASIEFKEGLTGIVGEYDDDIRKSMGAGKSSIFMSLLYSLFNKGSFKTAKEIVNDEYADKQHMFTKHRFIKNNILYEVERGFQQGASYLDFFQIGTDGEKIPLGENKINSRETEILRVLNWDYDMFTASIFFEQDKLSKLVDTDGSKKREYIEKVLHIRNWTLLQDFPKKKLLALEKDKISIQEKIIEIENDISTSKEKMFIYINIDEDIKTLQNQKDLYTNEINQLSQQLTNVKEEILKLEHLYTEYNNIISNKKDYDKFITNGEQEIESINNLISSAQNQMDHYQEKHKQLLEKQQELTKLKETNDQKINSYRAKIENISKEILRIEMDIVQIDKTIGNFEIGNCSQCEQEISEEYANTKKLFYISCKDVRIKEKENLEKECENLQNSLKHYEQNKKDNEFDLLSLAQEINKTIISLNDNQNINQNSIKESERIHQMIKEYKLNLSKLADSEKRILNDVLTKFNINDITQIPEVINSKKQLMQDENQFQSLTIQINNIDKEIQQQNTNKGIKIALENRVVELKEEKNEKTKELEEIKNTIDIENFILKGFRQIPSMKFNEEIEKLQNYANIYIKKFIPQMSIFINEDVSKANKPIDVFYTLNDKERSYRMLSGGQKTIGNLGLRLAFSNIISEKTSSASDFLILDEPFAYLDAYSRDLIKEVLLELQKIYRQIFVISHIDNVFEFPNVIKTQMRGQRSYIIS